MIGQLAGRANVTITPEEIAAYIENRPEDYDQEDDSDKVGTIDSARSRILAGESYVVGRESNKMEPQGPRAYRSSRFL